MPNPIAKLIIDTLQGGGLVFLFTNHNNHKRKRPHYASNYKSKTAYAK